MQYVLGSYPKHTQEINVIEAIFVNFLADPIGGKNLNKCTFLF